MLTTENQCVVDALVGLTAEQEAEPALTACSLPGQATLLSTVGLARPMGAVGTLDSRTHSSLTFVTPKGTGVLFCR